MQIQILFVEFFTLCQKYKSRNPEKVKFVGTVYSFLPKFEEDKSGRDTVKLK